LAAQLDLLGAFEARLATLHGHDVGQRDLELEGIRQKDRSALIIPAAIQRC